MKHSRLKGYKLIFYFAILFAFIMFNIWHFGTCQIHSVINTLTKETSGQLLEMLGVTFILFSICMKFLIQKDNGLFYLGILSIILGSWIYIRAENAYIEQNFMITIEWAKATLLSLAPFAVALYFNEFQNHRYIKLYQSIMIVSSVVWFGCMAVLAVSPKVRPTVYMSIQMVIILTLGISIYTLGMDTVKGISRYSFYIVIVLILCTIVSMIEILYVYYEQIDWIDEFYGFGLFIALIPVGLLTIYKQIQEQKKYEKMLIEEERDFLVKKLNGEIQKPIQKIIHFSEEMMDSCQDKETFQLAGDIQYESDNILKLVENVLSCVQIEKGTLPVKKSNIDSIAGMNEIINRSFLQIERKGLDLAINIADDFPRVVYGDYGCVLKICNILLDNAIRYSEKGTITFSVGWLPVDGDEITVFITVEDTGKGFEEEHLIEMKELFQHPELTKNHIYLEGVGYGLIAAMGLAREINATFRVESVRNKGTNMSVTFSQKVVDATPIGEFQSWYDLGKKKAKIIKTKEEIKNELKEEIRKELELEKRDISIEQSKQVKEKNRLVDNDNKSRFQDAVLQLEKKSIHIRSAMKYVADDFEQYVLLMKLFVRTAEEKQSAIKKMLEEDNYQDFTVKTHALKNNARTLGADDLADIAFAMEKASDKGDIPYVKEHFLILLDEWIRVKEVFHNYLGSELDEGTDDKKEKYSDVQQAGMPEEKITEQLRQIITYLDTFKKKEALDIVKELLSHNLRENIRDGILETQETIQKYDYAKAMAILEQLIG